MAKTSSPPSYRVGSVKWRGSGSFAVGNAWDSAEPHPPDDRMRPQPVEWKQALLKVRVHGLTHGQLLLCQQTDSPRRL